MDQGSFLSIELNKKQLKFGDEADRGLKRKLPKQGVPALRMPYQTVPFFGKEITFLAQKCKKLKC